MIIEANRIINKKTCLIGLYDNNNDNNNDNNKIKKWVINKQVNNYGLYIMNKGELSNRLTIVGIII